MKLQDVLQKVEPKEITGACDIEISGVQIDSRQITKGDLFVAERGTQVDGHKFIPAAIEKAQWLWFARKPLQNAQQE